MTKQRYIREAQLHKADKQQTAAKGTNYKNTTARVARQAWRENWDLGSWAHRVGFYMDLAVCQNKLLLCRR